MGWNRVDRLGRHWAAAVLMTLALAGAIAPAARSQPVVTSISNGKITAFVGVSETAGTTPDINAAGRFGVQTNDATPVVLMQALGGETNQSYVTVRIDGGPPTPGADADEQTQVGWDLIWGDVGSNALNGGQTDQKDDQGAWLQPPTVVGNKIVARWTTLPGGNSDIRYQIPPIEVDLELTLIGDMVRYKFTVINRDSRVHTVGLRFVQDYTTPNGIDGPVFTPAGSFSNEVSFIGGQVPSFWQAGDSRTFATVGGWIPAADEPGVVSRPDRLVFGRDPNLGFLWDFTPDPTQRLDRAGFGASDAVYFNERAIAPGAQQSYVKYFGQQTFTYDFLRPFAAGVRGPESLLYDPTKPAGQQLTPNPFTVTAFVNNPLDVALTSVSATISLPTGLELAPGEVATKTAASVAPGSEQTFSWQVVPTGTTSGRLTYSVSFAASPGGLSKSINRTIEVPSLPSQTFPGGLQMVSFPYVFDNPTPSVALGLNATDFDLLRYNPQIQQYETVTSILPGQGYWLNMRLQGSTVTLQGAHPVSSSGNFELRLTQGRDGWNQIGNPFLYRVRWSDVLVLDTDANDPDSFKPISVQQASDLQHQWILPTVYRYDKATGQYVWDQDFSTELVPFVGYWVRTLKPSISLLFPPSTGRAASVTRAVATGKPAPNDWTLRVMAAAPGTPGTWSVLGVSPNAKDGYDLKDVQEPPFVQGHIGIRSGRSDWGGRAGGYVQDIQASGGRKQWSLLVTSPKPDTDVTLSWPEVGNLPRGYELYITDVATGQRKLMRQTSSLRVNTGSSASRAITVTAEPSRLAGAFRIVEWSARPVGRGTSAAISVTTNQDASLSVRVLSAGGKFLRNLATRAASPGQAAQITWDYRDGKGVAVPTGNYIIEVRGTTPDGQSARVVIPHLVTR